MPPIDHPTRTRAEPAASASMLFASSEIIVRSASGSPLKPSAGQSASASTPLPGVSMATTSIHSGAAAASSEKACTEPPA
eukprot:scaffold206613_cov26-Tisochrysis_lutea.AAC.2